MSGFSQPWWLVAAGAWALAMALLAWWQKAPLEWIRTHVAERFRHRLTRYDVPSARRWHFAFLFALGVALIAAAAGPFRVTAGEREIESRTVLIVLDASLSMGATDTESHPEVDEPPASRFDQATRFATELVDAMPDAAFGLISFSGVTVVHSPPTRDRRALAIILDNATYHVNLTLSGTRYSTAFDAVIHMAHSSGSILQHERGGYQVVMISDGELPRTDDYTDALDVLAEIGVPVHTIGVGSTEGEGRVIYEPEDVINNVAEKRVAKEYHTRRVDSTLEQIADATGGRMMTVAEGDWVGSIMSVLERAEPTVVEIEGRDKEDLSAYPLAAFLIGFLIETLIVSRRPRRRPKRPSLRLGRSAQPLLGRDDARVAQAPSAPGRGRPRPYGLAALIVGVLLLSGCRGPVRVLNAHYHNELGVGLYHTDQHSAAAARFEKSMSYRVRRQIPLYNLGKNAAAREEFAVAHDYYQEAMLVEPRLVEAHYNDGHALYRWGEQEIDLEECVFERARQLFTQAAKRFRGAAELAGEGDLASRGLADAEAVDARLAELDELAENCETPPPPPSGGQGGGPPPPEDGEPPPQPSGEPPPGEPPPGEPPPGEPPPGEPPPSGGGGGLSEEEREEVQAALERIQQEAAGASGYRQSQHQQITGDTVGKAAGMEIWW